MKRHLSIVIGLAALVLIVTGGFYVARDPEHASLNDAARRGAPGRFVRLPDGVTHYDVSGNDSGQTVVLVHGFSVPYYIWDSTTAALSSAGFRVVRYDLYGRGLSDRPHVDYDAELYDRQLGGLIDSLHVNGPVDVAGLSMGGWIAGMFASRHPSRVRSVILVDPMAGQMGKRGPPTLGWPIIGSYLWQTQNVPKMAASQWSDFHHPERFPDWADRYQPQTRYRGFGRALRSTNLALSGKNIDSVYQVLGRMPIPVLLLWGTADSTVPMTHSEGVRKAIPNVEFHAIDDAGHLPVLERAALADSLIIDFLHRHAVWQPF